MIFQFSEFFSTFSRFPIFFWHSIRVMVKCLAWYSICCHNYLSPAQPSAWRQPLLSLPPDPHFPVRPLYRQLHREIAISQLPVRGRGASEIAAGCRFRPEVPRAGDRSFTKSQTLYCPQEGSETQSYKLPLPLSVGKLPAAARTLSVVGIGGWGGWDRGGD